MEEFRRGDVDRYVAEGKGPVRPGMGNRDVAAVGKLFSCALECGEVETHRLVRFSEL